MSAGPRAVVLDRDGTLVDFFRDPELGVVSSAFHPSHLRLLPGVVEGLRALQAGGFALAVATNQPGAAKGQFPLAAIDRTNRALVALLRDEGLAVAAFEVCPHHPEGGPGGDPALVGPCACRKPAPGMLLRIAAKLEVDAAQAWMIGDTASDVLAARGAGMRAALVLDTRRCELCPLRDATGEARCDADLVAPRFDRLAEAILASSS